VSVADQKTQSYSLASLTDATRLASKRQELETLRHRDKIDWTLNREFYKGNQWSFWNKDMPGGGQLQSEPTDEGDRPRYKVRLTSDQIKSGVSHFVAQQTKNKPQIYASPDSGEWRDVKAAQMAQALYDYWWQPDQLALGQKLQTSMLNAALSQGYWWIAWDALAGKALSFMVNPAGESLLGWPDDALDMYRDELRKVGIDPKTFEKTVYVGDISVKPMPGDNVLVDPTSSDSSLKDAAYCIITAHMSPDDVAARWKQAADVGPDASSGDESLVTNLGSSSENRNQNVRRVYHMYIRPGAAVPKGRYVCWIESPNMVLEDSDWPYPFTDLPLIHFPGIERPNSALDIPITTPSRPLQKELNRSISQVVEHKNLTLKPQLLSPAGSLQDRLSNEPGRVITYVPINGAVPQWRDIPAIPSYVYTHISDIQARLDRLFNRMPSQRDQLPARIDSGEGIDLIQETVADQIAPMIARIEDSLALAGMLMVKLAQKYYTEPRLLKIRGANGSVQVQKFLNADLEGGFSFHAEAGSGLPRTRAGKQARIEFLLTNKLIDERTAMRYLDIADMNGVNAQMQSDEEQAYRTIDKLKTGQVINVQAYQQALQQVQQVMADPTADPDGDGQPDTPQQKMQWAQQTLEQASVAPQMYEDYDTHIDVLKRFMTSAEFEELPPEIQQRFVDRYSGMFQARYKLFLMQVPTQAPRVALQVKSTASAPVMAEILQRSGVQVTDDEVAQPPLDTWVTDDLTKPAAQSSGNTQLDQHSQLQQIQQAQDQHVLTQTKAAHEAALSAHRGTQAQQAAQQAAELHAQQMAHAEQLHQEKLAQLRRPAPAKATH
jgi:hypothetical protein